MKLAFIVRGYHRRGGISRCVVELAKRFSQENEVHVFAEHWIVNREDENIVFHKVRIIPRPFFLEIFSFAVFSWLEVRKRHFDLIFSYLTGSLLKGGIVTAHSCHCSWIKFKKKTFLEYIRYFFNPLHRILAFLEKNNCKKGHYKKLIAVSRMVKHKLSRCYGIPDEDIEVIYNGVDIDKFNKRNNIQYRSKFRKIYNIEDSDIVLLFVAHEFRKKGLKYILRALSGIKHKEVKLIVAGRDRYMPYKKFSQKIGIDSKVKFAGLVDNIERIYSAGDIFILPTPMEAFGLVISEAMASELPVIVTRSAGASELIVDGESGLLLDDPASSDEIKEKIEILIDNPELRKTMGLAARRVVEKFTWDDTFLRTKDLINKINAEDKNYAHNQ